MRWSVWSQTSLGNVSLAAADRALRARCIVIEFFSLQTSQLFKCQVLHVTASNSTIYFVFFPTREITLGYQLASHPTSLDRVSTLAKY